MEIKALALLLLFFGSCFGQSIDCNFINAIVEGQNRYICNLNIQNPTGFDNFVTINGTHLANRTNADVTGVFRLFGSRSVNFPRILCTQFPNLLYVDFQALSVARIDENTLNSCANLEWLRFWANQIEEIHERAFSNNTRLRYLDLDQNRLTTLPVNVFSGLVNLESMELSNNPFTSIPGGLFRPLTNLKLLLLINARINSVNLDWFETLSNLEGLSIYGNNITSLTENTFFSLRNLRGLNIGRNPINDNLPAGIFRNSTHLLELYMSGIGISQINPAWFETLGNLEILYIYSNLFTSIAPGTFNRLTSLLAIDIGDNHLTESAIPGDLFDNMPDLLWLINDYNLIQTLNPQWFRRLNQLILLGLNFNQIEELQSGIFSPFENLIELDLWGNNLKTINRDSFGSISTLAFVDFDDNVINAIDERFLWEADPLIYLFLSGNLCTSESFMFFGENREVLIPRLAICTNNFRFISEITTGSGEPYAFFPAPQPGIQLRVNTDEEIHIALTPFDFVWNPMVEIVIGGNNNTASIIIRNQDTRVVIAHSPNVIRRGQWSGFRITYVNHVVLVTREEQTFPFLAYNLECIFPVGFYGLRSPLSRAVWSIQPVEAEVSPASPEV